MSASQTTPAFPPSVGLHPWEMEAVAARVREVYADINREELDGEELDGDADRPRVTDISDIYNFSDLDSEEEEAADVMKESQRKLRHGSDAESCASATSFSTCAPMTHQPSTGSTAYSSGFRMRLGRAAAITASAAPSDVGSCRSTWNMYMTRAQSHDWQTSTPRYSFGDADLDDFMDLELQDVCMSEASPGAPPMRGLAVVAGAASILKHRNPDGSLPDNASDDDIGGGGGLARSGGGTSPLTPSDAAPPACESPTSAAGGPLWTPAAEEWGQPAAHSPNRIAKSYVDSLTAEAQVPPRGPGSATKQAGSAQSSKDPFQPAKHEGPAQSSEDPSLSAPQAGAPRPPKGCPIGRGSYIRKRLGGDGAAGRT